MIIPQDKYYTMANKKSSAAQAIKDMLEMGIDITFFAGNINRIHVMNAEISIVTKERAAKREKTEVKMKVNYMPPEVYKPASRRVLMINPDGTVALGIEWDFD